MAGPTRLELATSGVTVRHSNQLSYDPAPYCPPIRRRLKPWGFGVQNLPYALRRECKRIEHSPGEQPK